MDGGGMKGMAMVELLRQVPARNPTPLFLFGAGPRSLQGLGALGPAQP
jgi:hypothetical protein